MGDENGRPATDFVQQHGVTWGQCHKEAPTIVDKSSIC